MKVRVEVYREVVRISVKSGEFAEDLVRKYREIVVHGLKDVWADYVKIVFDDGSVKEFSSDMADLEVRMNLSDYVECV